MNEQSDRILRDAEVGERTGMSRSTRWRLVKRNEFPSPVKLTGSTVGWRASEIKVDPFSPAKAGDGQWLTAPRTRLPPRRSLRPSRTTRTSLAISGTRQEFFSIELQETFGDAKAHEELTGKKHHYYLPPRQIEMDMYAAYHMARLIREFRTQYYADVFGDETVDGGGGAGND